MSEELLTLGGTQYRQDVQREFNELQINIERLEGFFVEEKFLALPDCSRFDLMDQCHYMRSYRSILKLRLGLIERK